ncbi:hypothetical protein HS088_TW05G00395 [Tripterygium wilfordii]|uniref:Stress response protein nst1 n=1 Tax=Tripterygium wilfordii TaxID=458696 RepID=A0A7J7DMV5_TRIWF|nr:stress response protein nst1-like isoform X2 [Tripterygium wilfordii]KAF5747668.1 hypothetical protein HS088_TW05G00395 [Tripterygium wilfordii]
MCILCVIQKWSRRVATMLPWLVIPLIGLWALSKFLPPAFRFEITSPRLACVFVLLVTLFWYEILMPQLSAWRVQRNARLRERKRFEAIELQKLRKTATRRCRNCSTPYKDQNPGGGRFMCSYCGHVSKRPVLDVSLPPSLGTADTGIIKDLVGKGGKILNGKAWNDNGWMCNQDLLDNGNWIGGSVAGKSSYWRKNGSVIFGGDELCLAEKSYSGVLPFVCNLLTSFLMSIRWLWRKILRVSSSREDAFADADHRGLLAKQSENGGNGHESRGEKARRKAEEKKQARLERELLEEEERKQREEVARLVEERRRLRDEKMEAEKDRNKTSTPAREKVSKREAEKKRQERRKEKDKGSSKSNSDAEELEKKACKEAVWNQDCEKKNDIDRREQKSGTRSTSTNSFNRGDTGTRYLDHMRGTLLSSSRAFSGGSFFGRGGSGTSNITTKENKFSSSADHVNDTVHRRDFYPPDRIAGKASINGDDKSISRPVLSEPQPRTAPKKSWQQLFNRSSSQPPSSNVNVISRPHSKSQSEVQSPQLQGQSSMQSFDNPISFGLPSPFSPPVYASGSSSGSLGFSSTIEPVFPHIGEGPHDLIPEEVFEDPCYIPDPMSLLGPVSESLDNFHLDLGTGFGPDLGLERPHVMKNISPLPEVHKPSPIESPLSRSRMADEKLNNYNRSSGTPTVQHLHALPGNDANVNTSEKGTWQMWNSSPLGQDGLGLVGGPASFFLPSELSRSNMEEFLHPPTQKSMTSLFTKDDPVLSGTHSPNVFMGNSQNFGPCGPVTSSGDPHPWLPNAFFPPLAGCENHFPLKPQEECNQNDMNYGSPHGSTTSYSREGSPANSWAKKEQAIPFSAEGLGKSSLTKPHIGNLFPNSDGQSLWSI